MKTKSKLVLGLSILSAATLAAGATSTFAWFSVGTATIKGGHVDQAVTVIGDDYAAGTLTFAPVIDITNQPTEIVPTDDNGDVYYHAGSGYAQDNARSGYSHKNVNLIEATIGVKVTFAAGNNASVTFADAMAAAAGTTYYLHVSKNDVNLKLSKASETKYTDACSAKKTGSEEYNNVLLNLTSFNTGTIGDWVATETPNEYKKTLNVTLYVSLNGGSATKDDQGNITALTDAITAANKGGSKTANVYVGSASDAATAIAES